MKAVIYPDEVERMRHALGIDSWKTPKWPGGPEFFDKETKVYRNRYAAENPSEVNDLWKRLVEFGLAETDNSPDEAMVFYHVTQKGIDFLGDHLGTKIIEVE